MDGDKIDDDVDTPIFPSNNLFNLRDKSFFGGIRSIGGALLSNILECRSMYSPEVLLNTDDVFEIFHYDIPVLSKLKEESCVRLTNGDYVVKPGIRNGLSHLIKLWKQAKEKSSKDKDPQGMKFKNMSLVEKDLLIRSLIQWCSQRELNKSSTSYLLLAKLIDSVIPKGMKPKNQRRHDSCIKEFSLCLYI